MSYTRADIGFPLGNRTVHFIAEGVPLSIARVSDRGVMVGSTVYFWDEQTRVWMWTHQTWTVFPIPVSELRRIGEQVNEESINSTCPVILASSSSHFSFHGNT